jgi:3-hydroxyacyl-[acyl-carrier-protein] dehydratase
MADFTIDVTKKVFGIEEIMSMIPHRYPFLLVDRIVELDPGKRAVGFKNLTMNEQFYQGHFPNKPIMPGVLQLEAMAQVGAVLFLSMEENKGKLAVFMSIDGVKFRKQIVPGDRLDMVVEVLSVRSRTGKMSTKGYVAGKLAVEAEMMFAVVDR